MMDLHAGGSQLHDNVKGGIQKQAMSTKRKDGVPVCLAMIRALAAAHSSSNIRTNSCGTRLESSRQEPSVLLTRPMNT